MAPTVLICGGSGYLGQFVVDSFSRDGWKVVYTYNTSLPPPFAKNPTAFKVDFLTGDGLDTCFSHFKNDDHHLDAVINCVAISQPAVCEKDPEKARQINIPTKLLDALKKYQEYQEIKAETSNEVSSTSALAYSPPLLIHLSTDQVYDGLKSYWKESDEAEPLNQYGKSKLEAEHQILSNWANHAILRSSLIYGKDPPAASVGRSLFLQFVDEKLASKEPTSFFNDEWRSAIYVQDIIRVCKLLVLGNLHKGKSSQNEEDKKLIRGVFNMGGPERLSRVDIAQLVAKVRQYNTDCIVQVPSASVQRGVASPSDISMDTSKLQSALTTVMLLLSQAAGKNDSDDSRGGGGGGKEEFKFTRFEDALHEIFNKDT